MDNDFKILTHKRFGGMQEINNILSFVLKKKWKFYTSPLITCFFISWRLSVRQTSGKLSPFDAAFPVVVVTMVMVDIIDGVSHFLTSISR